MRPIIHSGYGRFPGFRCGLILVIASVLFYLFFQASCLRSLEFIDFGLIDHFYGFRGPLATSEQIVIVDIDERSLNELGQFPWPRTELAKLLTNLQNQGVKVIGLDVVFAERDRTSLKYLLAPVQEEQLAGVALSSLPGWDHDLVLGEAVGATNTILGCVFITEKDQQKSGETFVPFPDFNLSDFRLSAPSAQAYQTIGNLPVIAQNALSEGFFNAAPNRYGTVRKAPLLMEYEKKVFPSLVVEMARFAGNEAYAPQVNQQGQLTALLVGEQVVPLNEAGQATINYRGPVGTFPYISAVDVIKDRALPVNLKDKLVLVGTSAQGLQDIRTAPHFGRMPGVEILATLLDNVLSGDAFIRDQALQSILTVVFIVFFGLVMTVMLSRSDNLWGLIVGFILIPLCLLVNYQLFVHGYVFHGAYALLTLSVVYLTVMLVNYFSENRSKQFIKGAFSRYLSDDLVEQIVRDPGKLSLQGESKELTVLFSDIRAFSSFSEKLTAAQLSEFLNEYLTAMTEIAIHQKGYIDKFIGDAVMAFWGAPVDDEAHAEHAVLTAMAMIEQLKVLQPQWVERGLPLIEIGVGINSGDMSVGNMGSERQFNYTVMGDQVNLGSRLEGLNKVYGTHILIGPGTKRLIAEKIVCRLIDQVRVKGKSIPVKIYEPLATGILEVPLAARVKRFEEALELYFTQDFDEAEQIFRALESERHEQINQLYIQRIQQFRQNPPGS